MKIFIAGDSTASIKEVDKRPETGWGEKLKDYLISDLEIFNRAMNGRSTKSFLDEGRLEEMIPYFSKGDYLLIQFGHNDSKIENPIRYASPVDYQKNLKFFIDTAKKSGVLPIILSSVTRRNFLEDNKTIDPNAVGEYPNLAQQVALKENVIFLDIFKKSKLLLEELGFDDSKKLFLQLDENINSNYPLGIIDNTHFNDLGAKVIASIILEELVKYQLPLSDKVNKTKLLSLEKIKNMI